MQALDIERHEVVTLRRVGTRLVLEAAHEATKPTAFMGPGWFDVQVNGYGGHDVNSGDLDVNGFEEMTHRLHEQGVCRYLPTVVTASPEHMRRCIRTIRTACEASPLAARAIAGIHLEGPFMSPEPGARGAHPPEHMRLPDRALFDDLQDEADGTIRLLTLAPEIEGAASFVRYLASHGIVVALGHTVADGEAIAAAVAAGARLSTHLGNGAPAQLPRHPNMIWEQLAEDRLYASAIFDGHHLPPAVMKVFARVKGPERLLLTSDAVALAGQPPGIYEGQVGGKVELHENGRLTVYDSPYLAGSASSMLDGVATAVGRVGLSPADAMTMAGRTPRTLMNRDDPDDWTVVEIDDTGVHVRAVAVDGELVLDRLDG